MFAGSGADVPSRQWHEKDMGDVMRVLYEHHEVELEIAALVQLLAFKNAY